MSDSMASAESPPQPATRGKWFPGILPCVIVMGALLAMIALRSSEAIGDIAIVNILTLILSFISGMTLLVWLVFVSSYPRWLRWSVPLVLLAAVIVFFTLYRIEHVAGDLTLTFTYRFAPARDATLEKPVQEQGNDNLVDLQTTTPDDFPQFLGPERSAVLAAPLLEHDWVAHPPRLVWKQPIGAGWSGFAVVNGYAVTLEQRGDDELVTCYEALTGKLRWSHVEPGRHSTLLGGVGPRSTPTIHNGRVYAQGAAGIVVCLDGATGDVLWRVNLLEMFGTDLATDLGEIAWGRAGSPLVVDELIVVPAGGSGDKITSLVALRQSDGQVVWRGGNRQISYASPALLTVAGERQIVSVNEVCATGHDPVSGAVLWETPWAGDSGGAATASQPKLIGDDQLLFSKGYSTGAKLVQLATNKEGVTEAETLWERSQVLKTKFTNSAIVGQHAYALSEGVLECVDVQTGKHVWKGKRRREGDYGQGQILVVGDVILVQAEQGDVVMVAASPEKFVELGRLPALQGQTWNTLCVYGNLLLVRNSEEAACYELPVR